MSLRQRIRPPTYVLLCLDPDCHGEFYLPLEPGEAKVCPNDREHPVEVYSVVRAYPAKLTGLPNPDEL